MIPHGTFPTPSLAPYRLDWDPDPTTVAIVDQPQAGMVTVDSVTGAVTYMPEPGFVGEDTFTYTVTSEQGVVSNLATVVVEVNDPPVASDDFGVTSFGQLAIVDLLANDADPDGTLDPRPLRWSTTR